MAHPQATIICPATLGVLLGVVAARLGDYPVGDQIRIYQALAEALPDHQLKTLAGELAVVLSRAEALGLEFREALAQEH